MNRNLIIYGAGSFAELSHYLFTNESSYDVKAFCVDVEYSMGKQLFGLPIVSVEEIESLFPPEEHDIFVAIGIKDLNTVREERCKLVVEKGYSLAKFVSPKASVAKDILIGPNTMIMEQCIVYPFSKIGSNTVMWTGSIVALKGVVEENCWIVRSTFGEKVNLGRNSFVGLETAIAPNVSVGAYSIIGTKAFVLKSVGDYSVFPPGRSQPSKVKSTAVSHLFA